LFTANWTIQEGQGRPLAKGRGHANLALRSLFTAGLPAQLQSAFGPPMPILARAATFRSQGARAISWQTSLYWASASTP
jgi:hypothetical protein